MAMSKGERMVVLHVIDSLGVGGAETLLVAVVNNLTDVENHVISLSDHCPLSDQLPDSCRFQSLGFRSKMDSLRVIKAIRRYIKQHKVEVVHSHLVLSNLLARLATPQNIRLVNSLHNLNGEKLFKNKLSWAYWAELLTLRKRHIIIAVSNEVLLDYCKYIPVSGARVVLYNFVGDRFFSKHPHQYRTTGALKTLAIGSLKPQKNFEFLIGAFALLPDTITLDIYGEGPQQNVLREEIRSRQITNVRLMGRHNALQTIMPKYDLLLMPSLYEGHPVALLEAMAAGMPALVSDIPVLREATNNGGIYFSLSQPRELQQILLQILNGELDINPFAKFNWELAGNVGRKENYILQLMKLYQA